MFTAPFRVFLYLLALFCFCVLTLMAAIEKANAADVVLKWTQPIAREDGSPLPPEEIAGYKILRSAVSGGPYTLLDIAQGPVDTYTQTGVQRGLNCYVLKTVDTDAQESVQSNEACKRVNFPPKAATNVSVTVQFTPPGQQ